MNCEIPFHVQFTLEKTLRHHERRLCAVRMYGQRWMHRMPSEETEERRAVANRLRSILAEIGPRERAIVRRAHREMKSGAR